MKKALFTFAIHNSNSMSTYSMFSVHHVATVGLGQWSLVSALGANRLLDAYSVQHFSAKHNTAKASLLPPSPLSVLFNKSIQVDFSSSIDLHLMSYISNNGLASHLHSCAVTETSLKLIFEVDSIKQKINSQIKGQKSYH